MNGLNEKFKNNTQNYMQNNTFYHLIEESFCNVDEIFIFGKYQNLIKDLCPLNKVKYNINYKSKNKTNEVIKKNNSDKNNSYSLIWNSVFNFCFTGKKWPLDLKNLSENWKIFKDYNYENSYVLKLFWLSFFNTYELIDFFGNNKTDFSIWPFSNKNYPKEFSYLKKMNLFCEEKKINFSFLRIFLFFKDFEGYDYWNNKKHHIEDDLILWSTKCFGVKSNDFLKILEKLIIIDNDNRNKNKNKNTDSLLFKEIIGFIGDNFDNYDSLLSIIIIKKIFYFKYKSNLNVKLTDIFVNDNFFYENNFVDLFNKLDESIFCFFESYIIFEKEKKSEDKENNSGDYDNLFLEHLYNPMCSPHFFNWEEKVFHELNYLKKISLQFKDNNNFWYKKKLFIQYEKIISLLQEANLKEREKKIRDNICFYFKEYYLKFINENDFYLTFLKISQFFLNLFPKDIQLNLIVFWGKLLGGDEEAFSEIYGNYNSLFKLKKTTGSDWSKMILNIEWENFDKKNWVYNYFKLSYVNNYILEDYLTFFFRPLNINQKWDIVDFIERDFCINLSNNTKLLNYEIFDSFLEKLLPIYFEVFDKEELLFQRMNLKEKERHLLFKFILFNNKNYFKNRLLDKLTNEYQIEKLIKLISNYKNKIVNKNLKDFFEKGEVELKKIVNSKQHKFVYQQLEFESL